MKKTIFISLLTILSINLMAETKIYMHVTSKIEKLKATIWSKVGSKIRQAIKQMNKITKKSEIKTESSDLFQKELSTLEGIRTMKKAELKNIENQCFGVTIPHSSKAKEEEYKNNWDTYRGLKREFKGFKFDFWRSLFRGTIQTKPSEWIW